MRSQDTFHSRHPDHDPPSPQDAWTGWRRRVLLTLAFEFWGGHFLSGKGWRELLADYDLLAGRTWVMVLGVTLLTPVLAFTRQRL